MFVNIFSRGIRDLASKQKRFIYNERFILSHFFFQLWNLPLLTLYLNILKLQSSNQTALHCVRPWQETRFYYYFLVSQKFGERYSPQSIPSAHVLLDHISNFLSGFLPQTNWQCLAMTQIKSTKEANALTQWLTRSWWLKEDS